MSFLGWLFALFRRTESGRCTYRLPQFSKTEALVTQSPAWNIRPSRPPPPGRVSPNSTSAAPASRLPQLQLGYFQDSRPRSQPVKAATLSGRSSTLHIYSLHHRRSYPPPGAHIITSFSSQPPSQLRPDSSAAYILTLLSDCPHRSLRAVSRQHLHGGPRPPSTEQPADWSFGSGQLHLQRHLSHGRG